MAECIRLTSVENPLRYVQSDRATLFHGHRLSWTFRISGCVGESLGETLEKAHWYFDEFCVVPGRR